MSIEGYKDSSVRIEVRAEGAEWTVAFEGALAPLDPENGLAPFFARLHRGVVDGHGTRVVIDIRALRFMGSASFKHFVTWLKVNEAEPAERRYRIHVRMGRGHHWQQVSIHALTHFSTVLTSESE